MTYMLYTVIKQLIIKESIKDNGHKEVKRSNTLVNWWNMYDKVLGIIPRSTYLSAPPVIVNVLPDPVYNVNHKIF